MFGGGAPYIDSGMGGINVSDYAMIKNGSYGKLMKAYYAKQDADKLSQTGDSSKTLTLMRSSADSLKKSAEALGNASLYEKKKFKKKDEETGEIWLPKEPYPVNRDFKVEMLSSSIPLFPKAVFSFRASSSNSSLLPLPTVMPTFESRLPAFSVMLVIHAALRSTFFVSEFPACSTTEL